MTRRRDFLVGTTSAAVLAAIANVSLFADPAPAKRFRAAVIGHTGRGNYGHGMDVLFTGRSDCEVVAVADPDDAGRAKAAKASGAARQYADYREMLAKERSELVAIGPRHTDQHVPMALAAIDAGAHVFIEKPLAASPAECDQILSAADRAKRKVAVAHQMRSGPRVIDFLKGLKDGLIGDLLQLDAWGKQDDRRAGGEDMMVLGTHLFDFMRAIAGDPQWCSARVTQHGKDITKSDAHAATEPVGPVAGDEITAQFAFPNRVHGTFTSRAQMRDIAGAWGIQLTGSKGVIRILTEVEPRIFVLKPGSSWTPTGRSEQWEPLGGKPVPKDDFAVANARLVDDWIEAIRTDRDPKVSGRDGAWAIEMAMAVYHAALSGSRAGFPLADRKHPLV